MAKPTEGRFLELLNIITTSFDSMFNVPLNRSLHEFAVEWHENAAHETNDPLFNSGLIFLPNKGLGSYYLIFDTIAPASSVMFDSEEIEPVHEGLEEGMYNEYIGFDVEYSYFELLAISYSAMRAMHTVALDGEYAQYRAAITERMSAIYTILQDVGKARGDLTVETMNAFGYIFDLYSTLVD